MRGDIILATGDPKRPGFMDAIIAYTTHGKFTHVEVDEGNGKVIGALLGGIDEYDLQVDANHVPVRVRATPEDIETGIRWLKLQVGERYGWLDIAKDGLKWLGFKSLTLSDGTYDCSDLVTRYLMIIHDTAIIPKLGSSVNDPSTISPNDLARAAGIL